MKKFISLSILLFVFFPIITRSQEISVVAENFPPFGFENENGEITGISTDILQGIIKITDIKIKGEIELMPWKRAYLMLQQQPDFLLYTVTGTPQRMPKFKWIGPIADRTIHLWKLKKAKFKLTSLEDAKSYRIAGRRGVAAVETLINEKGFNKNNFLIVDEEKQMPLLLRKKRVDLIIMLDWALYRECRNQNINSNLFEPAVIMDDRYKYFFALNAKTDDEIWIKMQFAFEEMLKNGEVERIYKKYK